VARSNPTAGWKAALIASAGLAVVFVIFGGINNGFSKRTIITLAVAGALLGAIGAPDFQPDSFRYPVLWQIAFAILGCVLVAFHFEAGPLAISSRWSRAARWDTSRVTGRATSMCPEAETLDQPGRSRAARAHR